MSYEKTNPLQYITDIDPVAEEVLNASGWFQTEYTYLEVTEEDRGMVSWLVAQGWQIYDSFTMRKIGRSNTEITGYQYWLKRRKLQSERVLNDMIREFTDAYNEGRYINDQRYDELVTLYAVMLDKTETELVEMTTNLSNGEDLIEGVVNLFPSDFATYQSAVNTELATLGSGREDQINIQFDARLAQAQHDLVNRGVYNSTIWPSVLAGIERERALALSALADTLSGQKISSHGMVHNARVQMRSGLAAAYERLTNMVRAKLLTPTEVRNQVLSAMFNFMERRTDEYPGLEGLATIAAQLGYGEGTTSAPTAS